MYTSVLYCYCLEILNDCVPGALHFHFPLGPADPAASAVPGALIISGFSSLAGRKTEVWGCPSFPIGKWKMDGASLADAFLLCVEVAKGCI